MADGKQHRAEDAEEEGSSNCGLFMAISAEGKKRRRRRQKQQQQQQQRRTNNNSVACRPRPNYDATHAAAAAAETCCLPAEAAAVSLGESRAAEQLSHTAGPPPVSRANMMASSVPSMVHRSGDSLVVRSVVSGHTLYGASNGDEEEAAAAAAAAADEAVLQLKRQATSSSSTSAATAVLTDSDGHQLPECKVKRNYSCNSCDFYTQNPRLYLYHLRDVHAERVRIYECPSCLYASRHFQKLLRHTKMVHQTIRNNNNNNNQMQNNNNNNNSAVMTPTVRTAKKKSRPTPKPTTPTTSAGRKRDPAATASAVIHPQDGAIASTTNDYLDEEADEDDEEDSMSSRNTAGSGGVLRCSLCSFVAQNRTQLARHERLDHIKTRFFRCTKCNYVTHMKARFTKHVKYHSMPMIKCDLCDFRTPYKWNLDRHCKNHNGNGQFRCSACNFTADIKQSLTVHEMNHHVPPVGQAAGLGVGRRRNKVGASDATAAVTAQQSSEQHQQRRMFFDTDDPHYVDDDEQQQQMLLINSSSDPTLTKNTSLRIGGNTKTDSPPLDDDNELVEAEEEEPEELDSGSEVCKSFPTRKKHSVSNNNSIRNNSTSNHTLCKLLEPPAAKKSKLFNSRRTSSDFIHPDDIVQHSSGNVYIKTKCKLCNFKSAWPSEMAKHEKRDHSYHHASATPINHLSEPQPTDGDSQVKAPKRTVRPVPNLIPLLPATTHKAPPSPNKLHQATPTRLVTSTIMPVPPVTCATSIGGTMSEPPMSQETMSDICANSFNSSLKDLASLFGCTDEDFNTSKLMKSSASASSVSPSSFFDRFKAKVMSSAEGDLVCRYCGHQSTCLTAQAKHQQECSSKHLAQQQQQQQRSNVGTTEGGASSTMALNEILQSASSSSRCQYCRQRCKSSADLQMHLLSCAAVPQPAHPMENRIFVWNQLTTPMPQLSPMAMPAPFAHSSPTTTFGVDFSNALDDINQHRIDDNVSLDLSIRTQSPSVVSDVSGAATPTLSVCSGGAYHRRKSPHAADSAGATTDKILTHGKDISLAKHKRVFKCPQCTFWASTASRFHVHIVGHLNTKPFECSLCAYRSNWRWDITKHISLKSKRDPPHLSAKVLMTNESGRRNYSKYNVYLTDIHVSSEQSMETSGGRGTRHRHQHNVDSTGPTGPQQQERISAAGGTATVPPAAPMSGAELPTLMRAPPTTAAAAAGAAAAAAAPSMLSGSASVKVAGTTLRPPPPLKAADGSFFADIQQQLQQQRRRGTDATKKTLFKCKKCNFRDASRDILLSHVKGHYPLSSNAGGGGYNSVAMGEVFGGGGGVGGACTNSDAIDNSAAPAADFNMDNSACPSLSSGDNNSVVDGMDLEEEDNPEQEDDGGVSPASAYSAIHYQQASSFGGGDPDEIDERHCRLKHSGDIRVVSNKNGQERIEIEEQMDEPDHIDVLQVGTFKCAQCPYSTDEYAEYLEHLPGHQAGTTTSTTTSTTTTNSNNSMLVRCFYCTFSVGRQEDLAEHLRLHGIHDPEEFVQRPDCSLDGVLKRFRCVLCPYITNSKSQYTYHKQFHRPRGGQYNCTHCSYNVSKRHLLHQHLKVHGIVVPPQKNHQSLAVGGIGVEAFGGGGDDTTKLVNDVKPPPPPPPPLMMMMLMKNFDSSQFFADIPLVWVSKHGKFVKMFKCRYCPHVNQRKVNIQEHEKMHNNNSINDSRSGDVSSSSPFLDESEHRCTDCNYVCNNAGVLSSHSKVHQESYGTIHCLVDPIRPDDEQIRELSRIVGGGGGGGHQESDHPDLYAMDNESSLVQQHPDQSVVLYFCRECPARFLKHTEYCIHAKLHGARLFYKCTYCTYTARQKQHLNAHQKVHSGDYQDRTRDLISAHTVGNIQPQLTSIKLEQQDISYSSSTNNDYNEAGGGGVCWIVADGGEPTKMALTSSSPSVPLSGTELFRQRHQQDASAMNLLRCGGGGRASKNPMKRYQCEKCPCSFDKRDQFRVHCSLHGSKQRYSCDECDYSVKFYANFVQHTKKHKQQQQQQQSVTMAPSVIISDDTAIDDNNNGDVDAAAGQNVTSRPTNNLSQLQHYSHSRSGNCSSNNSAMTVGEHSRIIFNQCTNCPYVNSRHDAMEEHRRHHISVSGVRNRHTCSHCDYSVYDEYALVAHTRVHFLRHEMAPTPNSYMRCSERLKLTAKTVDDAGNEDVEEIVCDDDDDEGTALVQQTEDGNNCRRRQFNNNNNTNSDWRKRYVNLKTGDVIDDNDVQMQE